MLKPALFVCLDTVPGWRSLAVGDKGGTAACGSVCCGGDVPKALFSWCCQGACLRAAELLARMEALSAWQLDLCCD